MWTKWPRCATLQRPRFVATSKNQPTTRSLIFWITFALTSRKKFLCKISPWPMHATKVALRTFLISIRHLKSSRGKIHPYSKKIICSNKRRKSFERNEGWTRKGRLLKACLFTLHYASITNRSLGRGLKFTYWSSSLFVSTCAVSFSFNEDAFLTSRMNSCR